MVLLSLQSCQCVSGSRLHSLILQAEEDQRTVNIQVYVYDALCQTVAKALAAMSGTNCDLAQVPLQVTCMHIC